MSKVESKTVQISQADSAQKRKRVPAAVDEKNIITTPNVNDNRRTTRAAARGDTPAVPEKKVKQVPKPAATKKQNGTPKAAEKKKAEPEAKTKVEESKKKEETNGDAKTDDSKPAAGKKDEKKSEEKEDKKSDEKTDGKADKKAEEKEDAKA